MTGDCKLYAAVRALTLAALLALTYGQTPEVCWVRQFGISTFGIASGAGTNRVTPVAGGSILVSGDTALLCFERTGELRWVFHFERLREAVADNQTFFYPARQDGVNPLWVDPVTELAFLGASSRVLYAIDIATGALRWSWAGARSVFESITGGDGRVHVETTDFKHWALDAATGRVLWGAEFRRVSNCQTGVFNGVLVRPNIDGWTFALNASTGAFLWQNKEPAIVQQLWEPDMPFKTFPAYPQGLAYISDSAGIVFAFDLRTGKIVWKADAGAGYLFQFNHRMNLELWGDLLMVQSQGFISQSGDNNYGILAAYNSLTGERLWIKDEVYPGTCGMTVSGGVLVYSAFIQPHKTDVTGPGQSPPTIRLVAIREDGSEVWTYESKEKVCTGSLQELDGIVYFLHAGWNPPDGGMQLLALPAARKEGEQTCPADVASPPPALPAVAPPMPMVRAAVASAGPYCWRQTLAYKPLGSPATDGERVYIQDNAGLIMAIDITTGEAVWKASAGPGSVSAAYPTNVLVADGLLLLGTAASEVAVLEADTGHMLWRFQSGSRPGHLNWYASFYGYPAYANGIMYIGTPDGFINAFNATTGDFVWSYYIDAFRPDTVQYDPVDGLVYAIAHDSDAASPLANGRLVAFDALNGTVAIFDRKLPRFVTESGFLNIAGRDRGQPYMVFMTDSNDMLAYSVGRDGGDLLWTYSLDSSKYGKQESVLLVDGKTLGFNDTDLAFWGDLDSDVVAMRLTNFKELWRINVKDIDLFPEMESLPPPLIWLQFTLSNGILYVPTSQGLFVLNATTGAPLWTDLRGRLNDMVLVVERPELGGPQVVYGRYLSNVDSSVPSCRPNNPSGGGISTLASEIPTIVTRPSPSPSPSPSSSPSPVSSVPSPAASGLPSAASPSPAASPAPRSSPRPSSGTSSPPTCPPCPTHANCSSAPAAPVASTSASVSLGLTVVSARLLKADKGAQGQLEVVLSKLIDSKAVRVGVTGVDAVGGSSSGAAVVRFALKASSSSSKALAAAVDKLQEAALDGKLQAALGAKGVRGGALAAAKVRSLVVSP